MDELLLTIHAGLTVEIMALLALASILIESA